MKRQYDTNATTQKKNDPRSGIIDKKCKDTKKGTNIHYLNNDKLHYANTSKHIL